MSTTLAVDVFEDIKPQVSKISRVRKGPTKKKRKRVGRACVFCQRSHMSCDEGRPCQRCIARGCADQCRDGKRKRRGRKRKNDSSEEDYESSDELEATQSNETDETTKSDTSSIDNDEVFPILLDSSQELMNSSNTIDHFDHDDNERIKAAIYESLKDCTFENLYTEYFLNNKKGLIYSVYESDLLPYEHHLYQDDLSSLYNQDYSEIELGVEGLF